MRAHRRPGFTLVEMIVVVALIAILASLAIPGLIRLGAFNRDELSRSGRELYTRLRAAQVYASTYHVNAAVVYGIDNYQPLGAAEEEGEDSDAFWIRDSLTGQFLRVLTTAAVMYEVPKGDWAGKFVPIPGELGNFTAFPGNHVVLLSEPKVHGKDTSGVYYARPGRQFVPEQELSTGPKEVDNTELLGLSPVLVHLPGTGPDAEPGDTEAAGHVEWFPAHVFKPTGGVVVSRESFEQTWSIPERFTLYVAPSPDAAWEERFVEHLRAEDATTDPGEWRTVPLYLYRSTGRVKIAS